MALLEPTDYNFRKIVLFLVPDAANWSIAHWHSNSRILDSIKEVHGKDYFKDLDEFFNLCDLLLAKWSGKSYYRELFKLKDIPSSIAALIWPTNMERDVCKQFSLICRVKPLMLYGKYANFDVTNPHNISQSWAFQQVWSWQHSEKYKLSPAVRANLMHIGLGDHPFIIHARNRAE